MPKGVYLRNSTRVISDFPGTVVRKPVYAGSHNEPKQVTVMANLNPNEISVGEIVEVLQIKRNEILRVASVLEKLNASEQGVRDNG